MYIYTYTGWQFENFQQFILLKRFFELKIFQIFFWELKEKPMQLVPNVLSDHTQTTPNVVKQKIMYF